MNAATGDVAQVTRIGTGLGGITSSSPALSVASRTGVAAFSVYENGKYDIYTLDVTGAGGAGRELGGAGGLSSGPRAAVLPPLDRMPSEVAALLADPTGGLPPPAEYPVADYKPSLQLEGLAQPTLAAGADRFGAAIGGGIAFQFGDMLGNHSLLTAVQLNSGFGNDFSFKNTVAKAMYFNQTRRWNWGIIGGQVPYLTGGFDSGVTTIQASGARLLIDDIDARSPREYPFIRLYG